MTTNLALKGIRVLDMGMFMAGPYCGAILADLGAEVIKIESCRRPDPIRVQARGIYPNRIPGERPWNRSGMINERNRNKLGITLDLTLPKGKEVFKRLVKVSDVVVENFSRKVLTGWELDYPALREVNPSIIMMSLTSQGLTGPEKDYVSFGPTLEQIGGLAHLTGYPDQISAFASFAYPDMLAGALAPGLIIAALRYRNGTGKGMQIDLSQRELATFCIGEVMMDYAMNKRVRNEAGNRHSSMAPYGCYPCQGEDRWVTIAIASDEEWRRFCQVMGKPELAEDTRFLDVLSRWKNQDELDGIITRWTKEHEHYDVMRKLQEAGLTAGAVLDMRELFNDAHLKERDFFHVETHPEAGSFPYKGRPLRLTRTPLRREMPAPSLGEHNYHVYGTLLGMSREEIQLMEKEGVIGTVPASKELQFT
ncbi:MAG: CoA transferase [Dehalococcoidia bacterium]|nr:CoA transferase [Dehalococcoidia bacterium]